MNELIDPQGGLPMKTIHVSFCYAGTTEGHEAELVEQTHTVTRATTLGELIDHLEHKAMRLSALTVHEAWIEVFRCDGGHDDAN